MAELNIGEAAALSPSMNFDLTTPIMRGAQFGMQERAAQAKALAASLKKNKILALDMSNIHPTLRSEAEKTAYESTAQMKMAADAGEDPMVYKNFGQAKLEELKSESRRRFELEKSNPDDYVMDQEAMTLFSQGKSKEARALLEKKGYDPQLISAINPEEALFLPKKVKIKETIGESYGYSNNPGLYRPAEELNVLPFGKKRVIMRLTDEAANAAALDMASRSDVQATILKEMPTQFKVALSKVMLNNPGVDPNVARGKAFVDVIKDPKNELLPTGAEDDEPSRSPKISITNYPAGDPNAPAAGLTTRQIHLKSNIGMGSYKGQKEFKVNAKVFSFNPQKVGMPTADLISTNGKANKTDLGGKTFESGFITSLPINSSDVDIILRHNGREFARIKPGEVVDPSYMKAIRENKDKIAYKPVALYFEKVDAGGTSVQKSYYAEVGPGDTNLFSDSELRSGQQAKIINDLQAHSDLENKKYGIGPYATAKPTTQQPSQKPTTQKPSQKPSTKNFKGTPPGGFN